MHRERAEHDSAVTLIVCRECGKQISDRAAACPQCGAPNGVPSMPKSRTTAAVLALLLGGLGVHKFYLGQPLWGLTYLLLCWTFVPALIGFLEGILLLLMSDATFQAKYSG